MSEEVKLPTPDELKRLSFRACVAYAVRASLRVRPLFSSDITANEVAVDAANRVAIRFVSGTVSDAAAHASAAHLASAYASEDDSVAHDARHASANAAAAAYTAALTAASVPDAHAVARTAHATATNATAAADYATTTAWTAEVSDIVILGECRCDYEKLLDLSRNTAGELGDPIDIEGDRGPLGPLWSKGEPEWFRATSDEQQTPLGEVSIVEPVYVPEDHDEGQLPTVSDLRRISLRACVAYAVRASLRVRPLFRSDNLVHEEAVDAANQISMEFVGAAGGTHVDARVIAKVAGDIAVNDVYTINANAVVRAAANAAAATCAAVDADLRFGTSGVDANDTVEATYSAVDDATRAARAGEIANECRSDYEKLLELTGDAAGELGDPINLDRLGPLWPKGEPEWFTEASDSVADAGSRQEYVDSTSPPMLTIAYDPEVVSPDDYARMVEALGDLVRAEGGLGIKRLQSRGVGLPSREPA